jgi:hypothetical protein
MYVFKVELGPNPSWLIRAIQPGPSDVLRAGLKSMATNSMRDVSVAFMDRTMDKRG